MPDERTLSSCPQDHNIIMAGHGHSNNPKRHRKQRHDNDSNNTTNERVDPNECITQAASVLAAIETRPEDAADLLETEVHNVSSFPTYRRMVGGRQH